MVVEVDRDKVAQLRAQGLSIRAIAARLSEAAKKGTSLAVETEPGVGLRSGLRWAEEWGRNNCFPLSGRIVLGFD